MLVVAILAHEINYVTTIMKYILKYYKPIVTILLIAVVVFGIGWDVWAVWESAGERGIDATNQTTYLASVLVHLMSWAWAIPAMLAGELMSNDLIYGQLVGLEHYFYQFWTLMRTIANFALVAIIVMVIGKIVTWGGEAGKIIRTYGVRLLAAGVLINFSWFIIWALVDVSTIMIAWVWQIWQEALSIELDGKLPWADGLIKEIPDEIHIDKNGCLTSKSIDGAKTNKTWNDIIEKRNEITWPLLFLGAGVMKFHAYSMNIGCDSSTIGSIGKITLKGIMQIFLMAMFVIPLVVLAAYNLFRLIYIWGWIIFSPLIVLINLFNTELKLSEDIKKAISLDTIISGLLQPVFTVWALVVGMMFVMALYHAMDFKNTQTLDNTVANLINKKTDSKLSFDSNDELGSVTIIDAVIEDPTGTLGWGLGYLLVSFATCFVLWMLVKMSFTMSKWWVWAAMWFDAQNFMEKMNAGFMQRVKLPDWWWPLGGASLKEAASFINPLDKDNKLMKKMDEIWSWISKGGIDDANTRLEKSWLGEAIGMQDNGDLDDWDKLSVDGYSPKSSPETWKTKTKELFEKLKTTANKQENKKTFLIDRADRNSYKQLKDWYKKDGWGEELLKWLKIPNPEKEGEMMPLPVPDFDKEYNGDSYLGWLIKHLATTDKIKLKEDGVLDWKPEKANLSKIDFKSL